MANTAVRAYRFGRSISTFVSAGFRAGGEVIPLRLKVFDTLLVLVENAGRLVTKQELLDTVWPETTVEENNLNHNVSVLRKALGEKATGQYIETVRAWATASPHQSTLTFHSPEPPLHQPRRRGRKSATARRATVSGSPMPLSVADRRW